MTTLAERKARAEAGDNRPRETVTLTFLSGEALFDEIKALSNEIEDLNIRSLRLARKIEAEPDNPPPRKGADKNTPTAEKAEVDAQIEDKRARLLEITENEL